MSVPYEKQFEFEAVSGEENYIELKFPHRGELSKFVLTQISGSPDGFSADLYNSSRAQQAAGSSSSSADGADSPEPFKVIPTQVVADPDGSVEILDKRFPYRNQDGTSTNPVRRLWLRINPGGAGTKQFQLGLGMVMPAL